MNKHFISRKGGKKSEMRLNFSRNAHNIDFSLLLALMGLEESALHHMPNLYSKYIRVSQLCYSAFKKLCRIRLISQLVKMLDFLPWSVSEIKTNL